jgi:NAD(P)-dependent dehydrogenase (short-subunit alcohol dehydrogenase family)
MPPKRTDPGGVVITGASTGIGRACALHLDAMGFRVFAGVRAEGDAEALLKEASGNLMPLRLDVTDRSSAAAAEDTVYECLEKHSEALSGLVNNAGIAVAGPLEVVTAEQLREQFEVNLIGQMTVTRAFLPMLRKNKGRIVNMGSVNGLVSAPFIGPYCASKFGLEALTDVLRMELKPWGISVSLVEPGSVRTPIWEKYEADMDVLLSDLSPESHELYGRAIAAARRGAVRRNRAGLHPERVARAVAHALTAKKPKTRYLIGWDAQVGAAMAKVFPDRLLDELTMRYMGLPI